MACTTFVSTWGSSIYSLGTPSYRVSRCLVKRSKKPHCSRINRGILCLKRGHKFGYFPLRVRLYFRSFDLYVKWCFSCADLLSGAPFSETNGQRLPMLLSTVGFALFMLATAIDKDIQAVLICRFFGGAFASAPLAVPGAVIADMFEFRQRGTAVASLVAMVFLGPIISLVIGAFMSENQSVGVS